MWSWLIAAWFQMICAMQTSGSENASPVELTAVVRAHNNERGFFDPENDVDGNVWYWWDVPAMLSSVTIATEMKVAPFVLQALPGDDPAKFPRAPSPEAQLRNNHLQYAMTWFSFAADASGDRGPFHPETGEKKRCLMPRVRPASLNPI